MCKIGAIILAAGLSNRMGEPKLLLRVKGEPLISYPVSLASENELNPIVIVTGKDMKQLQQSLATYKDVTYMENPQFESGMASSLKAGIREIQGLVDAAMIFLGDQPFIPSEVIQTLIQEYTLNKEKGVKIIRPRYAGTPGHPIIFDSSLFEQFESLDGDEGGKRVIQANRKYVKFIDFVNEEWGVDIDTPQDYAQAAGDIAKNDAKKE